MTIEEILVDKKVEYNGKKIPVGEMPINEQVEYLIQNHFKLFASKASKRWRMQKLYYIITKNAEKKVFKLNKAQMHLLLNYLEKGYYRLAILKARQLGMTTLIALYFLDEIIFNPNTEALQIAHTVQDAKEIFNRKIKYAVDNLPPALLSILTLNQKRANRVELIYPDKSKSSTSTSGGGRSGTFHLLHISELAKLAKLFPERAEEVFKGTIPSVPMDGRIIIESTAEGMNSIFYNIFNTAWKRRNIITPAMSKAEFYPVFYNWTWDEEEIERACADGLIPIEDMEESEIDWKVYQEDNELSDKEMTFYYLKYIQLNRDVDKLHQEYPTTPTEAFIGTGSNFFSLKKITEFTDRLDNSVWKRYTFFNNELHEDKEGDIWIKNEPESGRLYSLGADNSQGLQDGDFSTWAIAGFDKDIKAFFKGHIEPEAFARMLNFIGMKYNNALAVVESNDGGWVNTALLNLGYPNLYLRTAYDDITQTTTKMYGWTTNSNTRKYMLDNMRVWFSKLTECNIGKLLEEMFTFVRNKNGKPMALGKDHDDLIIAVALALAGIGFQTQGPLKESKPKSVMEYLYG